MTLQDWLKKKWLAVRQTNRTEIRELLAVADRDLRDCLTKGLSVDWQLNIAYNAALQSAIAALAASGFQVGRGEPHHFRVIQSLEFTIAADPELIRQFEQFRKKRNIAGYERAGGVSDQEAKEMIALARRLRSDVGAWLKKNHPELL